VHWLNLFAKFSVTERTAGTPIFLGTARRHQYSDNNTYHLKRDENYTLFHNTS